MFYLPSFNQLQINKMN